MIVWGKNDQNFTAEGAYPYRRDLKNVEFHLLDTGHFALEDHGSFIADRILAFMAKNPD
jgi:pimeloyl-ACP methyl ester carboxylesterase